MSRRTLLLCNGSHCRKAAAKGRRLQEAVERLPVNVERVGCQKVCRGPVAGLSIDGEWEWFERMGTRKAVSALTALIEEDVFGRRLEKRRCRKRSGKRRS